MADSRDDPRQWRWQTLEWRWQTMADGRDDQTVGMAEGRDPDSGDGRQEWRWQTAEIQTVAMADRDDPESGDGRRQRWSNNSNGNKK